MAWLEVKCARCLSAYGTDDPDGRASVFRADMDTGEVQVRHRRRRSGVNGRDRWISLNAARSRSGFRQTNYWCSHGHLFRFDVDTGDIPKTKPRSVNLDAIHEAKEKKIKSIIIDAAIDGLRKGYTDGKRPNPSPYGVLVPESDGDWQARESVEQYESDILSDSLKGILRIDESVGGALAAIGEAAASFGVTDSE